MTTSVCGGAASDQPTRPSIDVVIPTVGRDSIVGTVASVLEQQPGPDTLFVVVNKPDAGPVRELLAHVDDPRLRIVGEPVRGPKMMSETAGSGQAVRFAVTGLPRPCDHAPRTLAVASPPVSAGNVSKLKHTGHGVTTVK